MKHDCDVIQDLLPLYVEDMISMKTKKIVEDHLEECVTCRNICQNMKKETGYTKMESTNSLQLFRRRIIYEGILAILVEMLALTYIGKYVFAMPNLLQFIMSEFFIILPLIAFITCFQFAVKKVQKAIGFAIVYTVVELLIFIYLLYMMFNGDIVKVSQEYVITCTLVGGAMGLLPSIAGISAVKFLRWKRNKRCSKS
ncbi:zf-HC2 domain-containing protein [Anaerosporobacter faecicola]|uniref:zf-HC2 domain-containing protein n=1 Tax=Anaerosporobacter faecicola TaxID=2718714 RepID=UPI00143CA9D7|nr:zf-HC2 domain-containing protein [Anaerosporobacter faecicola]